MENIELKKGFDGYCTTYYFEYNGRNFLISFEGSKNCHLSNYTTHELDNNGKVINFCGRYITQSPETVAIELIKKYKL